MISCFWLEMGCGGIIDTAAIGKLYKARFFLS
jgi:hypothetical protein